MANPMETKLLSLRAGPPWHLRGPGRGSSGAGSRLPPSGALSSPSLPSFRLELRAARHLRGAPG
eukprot:13430429-Alexandrium_andersonii.AAC.1